MLKKCFKYDFKSIFKIWWIAAVTLLAVSVAAGFCARNIAIFGEAPGKHFILEITVLVVYYFSIFALGILTSVLLCIRFYSYFYSDEGYLTFTLPVKRRTLFASKVLNGFVFAALSAATVIASLLVIATIVPSTSDEHVNILGEIIEDFIEFFTYLSLTDVIWAIVYIIEAVIIMALVELSSILLLYMLITLGSVAVKKLKAVATVGFIVGAGYVLSALLIPAIFAFALWSEAANYLYNDFFNETHVSLILLLICTALGTASALFANVTQGCIDRKLNLS